MFRFAFLIVIFISLLIPGFVLADNSTDMGALAENLMEPAAMLSEFISNGAIVIGITFLFASVIKYFRYRENPMAVPISDVVFLFIFGVLLICLPVAYKLLYTTPPVVLTNQK